MARAPVTKTAAGPWKLLGIRSRHAAGFVAKGLCAIPLAIGACVAASHLPWVPNGTLLSGFGYAPDVFLFPGVSLAAALAVVLGAPRLGLAGLGILCLLVVSHLDIVRTPLHKESRLEGAVDPIAISIQAVNLRYYSFGPRALVDFFRRHPADFVLLSENTAGVDEIQSVWNHIPGATFHMGRGSETGLLSRWPLESFKEVELPSRQASLDGPNAVESQKRNTHRSFVHAVALVGGARVNVISVRFVAGRAASGGAGDTLAWGRYLLGAQRDELAFFLRYLSSVEGPVVFGGDLNATPGSFVVRALANVADDAWLATRTFGAPTFSTIAFPFVRLDFLFTRGARPMSSFLHETPISDHAVLESAFAIDRPHGARLLMSSGEQEGRL